MIRKPRNSRGFTLVELMIVVAIVGILAALAIFGVKKYVTNSKTAEARNSLGQISKDAAGAWSRELMVGSILQDDTTVAGANVLCKSSTAVPSAIAKVKGQKYQSILAGDVDYNSGTQFEGWKCLRFMMEGPQYYQYQYVATTTSFDAIANGDLDADGVQSKFTRSGEIRNGQVALSPAIIEDNPDE